MAAPNYGIRVPHGIRVHYVRIVAVRGPLSTISGGEMALGGNIWVSGAGKDCSKKGARAGLIPPDAQGKAQETNFTLVVILHINRDAQALVDGVRKGGVILHQKHRFAAVMAKLAVLASGDRRQLRPVFAALK